MFFECRLIPYQRRDALDSNENPRLAEEAGRRRERQRDGADAFDLRDFSAVFIGKEPPSYSTSPLLLIGRAEMRPDPAFVDSMQKSIFFSCEDRSSRVMDAIEISHV
jgi:hypothetical protein